MDKILKLILGCLGMIGVIVMIIPNSDPLAKKDGGADVPTEPVAQNASVAPPPPPPPPPDPNANAQAGSNDVVVEDYGIGNFGDPMVDPRPPGERAQAAQQQQQMQQQQYGGALPQQAYGQGAIGPAQSSSADGTANGAPSGQPQNNAF